MRSSRRGGSGSPRPGEARASRRGRPRGRRGAGAWGWVVLVVALVTAFVALACISRLVPELAGHDRQVTDAFVAWRSPGWNRAFWIFTLIGDDPLMGVLAAALVAMLAVWGWRARAAAAAIGLAAAWVVMHIGKAAVGRARPPAALAVIDTPASHSMPSGHALISVVFFGLLAYVAWAVVDDGLPPAAARAGGFTSGSRTGVAALRWAVAAAGMVCVAMTGLSRVYLGVHWLSDVVAGWCLGAAVLIVTLRLAGRWRGTGGPHGLLAEQRPWSSPRNRVLVTAVTVIVVGTAAAVAAWIDPLVAQ